MLDELLAHDGVVERVVVAGPIGVMALHGGIEEGTSEMAADVARSAGVSLYSVTVPDDLWWHVPSTEFDPRRSGGLAKFLTAVGFVFSLHGYGRDHLAHTVLLGGRNRRVADLLGEAIRRRSSLSVITEIERIPAGLRGVHPSNPVNLPVRQGVQIELPPQARSGPPAASVVEAVSTVARSEMRSVCRNG